MRLDQRDYVIEPEEKDEAAFSDSRYLRYLNESRFLDEYYKANQIHWLARLPPEAKGP